MPTGHPSATTPRPDAAPPPPLRLPSPPPPLPLSSIDLVVVRGGGHLLVVVSRSKEHFLTGLAWKSCVRVCVREDFRRARWVFLSSLFAYCMSNCYMLYPENKPFSSSASSTRDSP